jgi:hypothetical protein
VYTVPAWRDRRALGGDKTTGRGPPARPVRPVLGRLLDSLVSLVVMLEGSVPSVVEEMVSTLSLVVLSLLDVLHLVINTSSGEVAVLSLRGATDHGIFLWHSYSSMETGVVFPCGYRFDRVDRMDRIFDRRSRMSVANPTFEEMARHWFNTFGTNPSVKSFARSCSWF